MIQLWLAFEWAADLWFFIELTEHLNTLHIVYTNRNFWLIFEFSENWLKMKNFNHFWLNGLIIHSIQTQKMLKLQSKFTINFRPVKLGWNFDWNSLLSHNWLKIQSKFHTTFAAFLSIFLCVYYCQSA